MKLEGTYTFAAPRDVVWGALMDPEILARVMPGCDKLEQVGDNDYQGMIKIRVGPVQGKFQGKVSLLDINEPNNYRMIVDGKGATGFMKGEGQVQLEAQGDSTVMHYAGEAQVGGRLASVGQRLIDSSAKALTKQSLDGLNKQIQARIQAATHSEAAATPAETSDQVAGVDIGAAAPTLPPVTEVEAPSEVEFALGVAKNMLEDLVPPERRPTLIAAGFVALALFLFLNWWANVIARKVAAEIWERR
jgi:carbon monoxide dehydrogenase subunit G